jgi:hypothetical protein
MQHLEMTSRHLERSRQGLLVEFTYWVGDLEAQLFIEANASFDIAARNTDMLKVLNHRLPCLLCSVFVYLRNRIDFDQRKA